MPKFSLREASRQTGQLLVVPEQGIRAQFEEVVVDSDLIELQRVKERGRDVRFDFRSRGASGELVRFRGGSSSREGGSVDLLARQAW